MKDVLGDIDQSKDIEEEIEQIEKNKTWILLRRPKDKNLIGTKWVYRNTLDENDEVTRTNKDKFVKDMNKKKGFTIEKHLPLLQDRME